MATKLTHSRATTMGMCSTKHDQSSQPNISYTEINDNMFTRIKDVVVGGFKTKLLTKRKTITPHIEGEVNY